MENNVRCMGNYLNYIQVLCNNINFYFHSFTHSFIMLIIYRTRRKEIKLYSSSSLTKWYEIQIKNTSYLQRAKKIKIWFILTWILIYLSTWHCTDIWIWDFFFFLEKTEIKKMSPNVGENNGKNFTKAKYTCTRIWKENHQIRFTMIAHLLYI